MKTGPLENWNEELEIQWEPGKGIVALVHKHIICHKTGPRNCLAVSSISIAVDSLLIPISDSPFIYYERWNRPHSLVLELSISWHGFDALCWVWSSWVLMEYGSWLQLV